jgi:hypothetical protein
MLAAKHLLTCLQGESVHPKTCQVYPSVFINSDDVSAELRKQEYRVRIMKAQPQSLRMHVPTW